jgi:diguanylate cyclase (GGDEF)-like protein
MVVPFEGKQLKVTASVGLAEVAEGDDPSILIRRADDALYTSKEAGRNNGHYHNGESCVPITPGKKVKQKPAAPEKTVPEVELLHTIAKQSAFEEELHRRVAESHRFNVPLSVMTIVVEDFERKIAGRSQAVRDALLDAVAQFLKSTIRGMDLLSWSGREAFNIMLPGSTKAEADLVSQRIDSTLANFIVPVGEEKINLSVFIGSAELEPGQETDELLQNADPWATAKAPVKAPLPL